MMNLGLLLSLFLALSLAPAGLEDISKRAIATVVRTPPAWQKIESGSDQRPPIYVGASPYEAKLLGVKYSEPTLYESMRTSAIEGAAVLLEKLKLKQAEFEVWPAQDDEGQRKWVFARYRLDEKDSWQWLEGRELKRLFEDPPSFIMASSYFPWVKNDQDKLFTDVLKLESLYDKPLFGECLWTDESGTLVYGGWISPTPQALAQYREKFGKNSKPGKRVVCHSMPQPASFNSSPVTFRLRADERGASFVESILWQTGDRPAPVPKRGTKVIQDWGKDFTSAYANDVRVLAGEKAAVFPSSGRKETFLKKNSIDPDNQLLRVVDYLAERYAALGIKSVRQRFFWHGVEQANLIAIIPGSLPQAENRPILLGDHIDAAFSEDEYKETGKRVSAPGADDNASATAVLLRAAEIFNQGKPKHDIWLVHFTGEEFPGDCLGAREFVASLLARKSRIGGLILMDMIGYRDPATDPIFQINVGETAGSFVMGEYALGAALDVAPELEPRFQLRFDPKSYLYNTDGIVFSDNGFPVVLFNEHINKLENLERRHYHETSDTSDKLDFDYATSIAKTAIEAAARMSEFQVRKRWRF